MTAVPGERLESLDVLRGVAVAGLLYANISGMGLPFESPRPAYPAQANLDWILFSLRNGTIAGAMRGLFTLLFGASMILLLRANEAEVTPAADRDAYLMRCVSLLLLGLADALLFLWPGDILFNYGLCGLVLILFARAPVRLLYAAAAALLLVVTLWFGTTSHAPAAKANAGLEALAAERAGRALAPAQREALEAYRETVARYDLPADVRAAERAERTRWPGVLAWSAEAWMKMNVSAIGAVFAAESLAFMLLGAALFRQGVLSGARPFGWYAWMALGGGAGTAALRGVSTALQWRAGYLPDPDVSLWAGYTGELSRLCATAAVLGLVLMACKAGLFARLRRGLAALGRLALTNYLLQSLVTSALFYAFGLFDRLSFSELMAMATAIVLLQLPLSVLWLRFAAMGPAEWLLRRMAYGRSGAHGPRLLKATSAGASEGLARGS